MNNVVVHLQLMLFNATEFEQYFSARTLKQGWRLFEHGKVSLSQHLSNGEFHFLVDATFDLKLKKRGDKILSYACSCRSQSFCEHLCAALFYFQKDALGITIKTASAKKAKAKTSGQLVSIDFKHFLNGIAHPDLIDFVLNHADDNDFFRRNLEAYFYGRSEDKAFQFYCIQIEIILESYLGFDRLNQNQIDEFGRKITTLVDKTSLLNQNNSAIDKFPGGNSADKGVASSSKDLDDLFLDGSRAVTPVMQYDSLFCLNLAIAAKIPLIFNRRLVGDESQILSVLSRSMKELDKSFERGLSKMAQESWFEAVFVSGAIKNRPAIRSFTFLIPKALSFIKRKQDFDRLKTVINKRRSKPTVFNQLDEMAVARLQFAIKDAELFNTPFPFKNYRSTPEFVIAEAELFFCNGKTEAGFAKLENFYEEVKADHGGFLMAYLEYIILKANERNMAVLEIKYLKESFIYGLYIAPKQLDRFFELLPANKRSFEIDELIQKIKKYSKDESLDKLSVLLLKDNRPDNLITELKRYKNKFSLVHKIALQKLPAFDDIFLSVYSKHLTDALTDAAYDQCHEQFFLTAKKYLDQIPRQKAMHIANEILDKLGAFSHIYKFIKRLYPDEIRVEIVNKLRGKG